MRSFGFILLAAAIVGLTACRCNKSAGPQPAPSMQSAATVATVPSTREATGVAGATSATDTSGMSAGEATPMVLVKPLDFAPVKGSKFLPMKLKQDGVIVRKDKPIAKISGDKLTDDDGSPIATFLSPASIAIEGSKVSFKFNDKDELEGPEGLRIAVADDGVPTIVPKTSAKPEALTGKFVDFDPKVRRAAAIVLGIKEIKKAAKAARPKSPDGKKDKKKGKKKKKS